MASFLTIVERSATVDVFTRMALKFIEPIGSPDELPRVSMLLAKDSISLPGGSPAGPIRKTDPPLSLPQTPAGPLRLEAKMNRTRDYLMAEGKPSGIGKTFSSVANATSKAAGRASTFMLALLTILV